MFDTQRALLGAPTVLVAGMIDLVLSGTLTSDLRVLPSLALESWAFDLELLVAQGEN